MATQKRTGGVEKIGLPLADEHSVRKVIRSLAGIFDLDLVSRMFKDESILPAKIVGGIPVSTGITMMTDISSATINNPTLNDYTEVLLSSFSTPIPDCKLLLSYITVLGTANPADELVINASFPDNTDAVYIIESVFNNNSIVSIGGLFIPTISDDRLRLYFNSTSPIISVDIRAIAYLP